MKLNKSIALTSLVLLLFLSIGMAAANENTTIESEVIALGDNLGDNFEDNGLENIEDEAIGDAEKITLVSENITVSYKGEDAEIVVWALDDEGNHISGLDILMDGEFCPNYDDENGYVFSIGDLHMGTHFFEFTLDDDEYQAEPILVKVDVLKPAPILTANTWYSTPNQYVTLKVDVETDFDWIYEGTVTFKINGKSYTVNVRDGEAIKQVKIKKAGTYKYTATFRCDNYKTKTVSGKVYVYSTSKKTRTFSIKGYKVVVPVYKYRKLVNAKNTGERVSFEINTKKRFSQKVGFYKTVYVEKYMGEVSPVTAHQNGWICKNYVKHWFSDGEYYYTCDAYKKVRSTKVVYKTVNAKVLMVIAYGGDYGGQTAPANKYRLFLTTPYQTPGYDSCKPILYGNKISRVIDKLN